MRWIPVASGENTLLTGIFQAIGYPHVGRRSRTADGTFLAIEQSVTQSKIAIEKGIDVLS
jgi:hypothetical protein